MNEFEQCDLGKETNDFHNTYTFYQSAIQDKEKRKCFKDVLGKSAIAVCEVKFGAKIFLVYSPLNIKLNNEFNRVKMQT